MTKSIANGTQMRRIFLIALPIALLLAQTGNSYSRADHMVQTAAQKQTQIVLLGTGTPNADPERSGPSVAIVVNDTPYLVDFGPGVVRRAAAAFNRGVRGLEVKRLKTAFVTHLQSDAMVGS